MKTYLLYFPNGFEKTKERGAFFIFCPNTHELSSERLTPLAYNGSRLEAVAKFGNVNFPLLLNFLRKINVIKPHILPLLSNRC